MQYTHISKSNLLDLIHGLGRTIKRQASPNYWACEDTHKAERFAKMVQPMREAYAAIQNGTDPVEVMAWLIRQLDGVEANHCRLIVNALNGRQARTEEWLRSQDRGFHWVSFGGDLYGVDYGDRLNLPRVYRFSNQYLPEDKRDTTGSAAIAAMLPNPCERIKAAAKFA